MKPGGNLKRSPSSSSLKRKQPKRSKRSPSLKQLRAELRADVCFMRGLGEGIVCSATGDRHHLIPKQTIKRQLPLGVIEDGDGYRPTTRDEVAQCFPDIPLVDLLRDERNLVPVCRTHHALYHSARFKFKASDLPPSVLEFATEYGLEAQLEKLYPGSSAYRKGSG